MPGNQNKLTGKSTFLTHFKYNIVRRWSWASWCTGRTALVRQSPPTRERRLPGHWAEPHDNRTTTSPKLKKKKKGCEKQSRCFLFWHFAQMKQLPFLHFSFLSPLLWFSNSIICHRGFGIHFAICSSKIQIQLELGHRLTDRLLYHHINRLNNNSN